MGDSYNHEKGTPCGARQVPQWLWRGTLTALGGVFLVGASFVIAMALGWRSPTPLRAPDWQLHDLRWKTDGRGQVNLTEEGIHVRLSESGQRTWFVSEEIFDDFEVELVIRCLLPSEDNGFGLLYRYQDAESYHSFGMGSDGYYSIATVDQGQYSFARPWQEWPHIRRGIATNRLRLTCQDQVCNFYINGEHVARLEEGTKNQGALGLWAQTFSDDGLDLIFQEMRIWER
jgi:hypothetical protein